MCTIALLAGHSYTPMTHIVTFDAVAGVGQAMGLVLTYVNLTVNQPYVTISGGSSGGGGGGGCVLSGTQVLLPGGSTQTVDKLKVGDSVTGYNLSSSSLQPITVTGDTPTHVNEVMSLNNGLLVVTPTDQPLYVRNGTWTGWVRDPNQLTTGEQVFGPASGTWVNLTIIETLTGNFKVWTLSTNPLNNFIANGVLVDSKQP